MVTGMNSTWNITGLPSDGFELIVGEQGNASLTIADGATVTAKQMVLSTQANGTVLVTGVGSILNSEDLLVGMAIPFYGSSGNLNVMNDGQVQSTHGYIGGGGVGTATVSGTGSAWVNTGDFFVGSDSGNGTLTVSAGGNVTSGNGYVGDVYIDTHNGGAQGTALVTGAVSSWSMLGDLSVGNGATGNLTVATGGTVADVNGLIGYFTGTYNPFYNPGANGTVTVTGANSTWINSGNLTVGDGALAFGSLTISDGGNVTSAMGNIAITNGSNGTVLVTGVGSVWNNAGNLTLGGLASGGSSANLTIAQGGKVFTQGLILKDTAGVIAELGGTTAGVDYGEIDVSGNATFGGTLVVSLVNGYTPGNGDSFQLFVFGPGVTITGTFAAYDLPSLGGVSVWNTGGLTTNGILTVEPVPEPAWAGLVSAAAVAVVVAGKRRRIG
jgi:T5SS/PEP-CTERM-associated repeat protein